MDFRHNARTLDLIGRLETFMQEHVYPQEARFEAEMAPAAFTAFHKEEYERWKKILLAANVKVE